MDPRLSADELGALVGNLFKTSALIELALVVGCLALAFGVVRAIRGNQAQPGSIWFGDSVIDGVLFPILAVLFALVARWVMQRWLADVVPVAIFKLVVPVLLSLAVIRLVVRVLQASFPQSALMRVVERSVSWVAWVAVVLWITGILPVVLEELDAIQWKIGSTRISLRNLLEGVVSAVVVLMAALWLSAAIESRLLRGAKDHLSVRKMAANAVRALLLFVGLMFALSAAGIDLTALGVLGGALGVGLGFGLQKLASNYVSGFVILAERSMRIGDMVKVDNFEGRITDISTRYTVIRALNGREAIVPNEMMITQRVENSSLADPKVSINTVVQVAYGTDLDTLMPQLARAVGEVKRVLADPAPVVHLSSFAADGLELTVGFWIGDMEAGQGNVKSDVNLAILRALNEAGIEIPFPQRVMHQLPNRMTAEAAGPTAAVLPTASAAGPAR
jgi:small-conductance mechanosensitive channel